jgi:Pyruvate/2-oxoacid:ferredoxin oxidoreductase gamma subunit/GNAT superfamily N-acetyltransferase
MKIRKARAEDCRTINTLMGRLIEEIYAHETEDVRKHLKANFTQDALKELCSEKQAQIYVAVKDRKIVAFLMGWIFQNVFTIYWMYCRKEYRGKGIIKDLLHYLENGLSEKRCYKIEMYAYAEHNRFLNFCSRLGFKKGILLKKNMFGLKIRHIYKYIGQCSDEDKIRRIKVVGEAGQGVKLMSYTLASILSQLGNEVSLNLEYDSAVRSGVISADLIYSENKIDNPIIDEADVLIKFTKTRDWFPARNLLIDESLCGVKNLSCSIFSKKGTEYGFENVAISKFGNKIFINMIALGRILRFIGINIMLINIKDLLPPKSVEKNLAAIKYGFNFRDDV